MVRVKQAIAELRALLSQEGPIDQAKCRKLILRATSRMSNLHLASAFVEELGFRFHAVELAEIIGDDRQSEINLILERLDEIEALDQLH